MKKRILILLLMNAWNASLHWADLLKVWKVYPLYPHFPLFGLISYNLFWTVCWTIGCCLVVSLMVKKSPSHSK